MVSPETATGTGGFAVNPFRALWRFVRWLFRPRRTAEDVARELIEGLEDGSITLDGSTKEAPQ